MAYKKEDASAAGLFVRQIALREALPPDHYVAALPVTRHLSRRPIAFTAPVTFFVGENGAGKSTLIEALAIAMGFNPEGGSKNFNFSTENSHSSLHEYLRVSRGPHRPRDGFFLRAESFYNVASSIDQMDREGGLGAPVINSYGGVSLHRQSHGESFLSLVENRFGGSGLYILDEPEAALSPIGILRLMYNMHALEMDHSQFIISTHSPMLMAYPGAQILEITPEEIRPVPWQEAEHVRITREFLAAPDRMLRQMWDGQDC